MKLGNSKFNERITNNEAVRVYKRNYNLLMIAILVVFSFGLSQLYVTYDKETSNILFQNPFTNKDYLKDNFTLIAFMFTTTIIIYLFHFGNTKKAYIKKLEKARQKILHFFPIPVHATDERNLYIRFGLKYSLYNNFLKRKVHLENYLKRVDFLNIFADKFSPHLLFCYKARNSTIKLDIGQYFLDENYFIDMFKIIEGYLKDNIDESLQVPLNEYRSIGGYKSAFTKKSVYYFIQNSISDKKIEKALKKDFNELYKNNKDDAIKNKQAIIKIITKHLGQKGLDSYKVDVSKMVIFSPLAIHELLEKIYTDSRIYYNKIKLFKTNAYIDMQSYGTYSESKLFEALMFCFFYKIMNNFIGLPSGLITARIKDWDLSRILDDFEHFEASCGIRQIKKFNNDKKSKYDDTFARTFMIFYHDYMYNSKHKDEIKKILLKFDPLLPVQFVNDNKVSTFFGNLDEKDSYIPQEYIITDFGSMGDIK